jgi:hypothetical protein
VTECLDLITSDEERVEFASLNNACAEKALISASFETALVLIRGARRLLSPELENRPENLMLARSMYLNLITILYRCFSYGAS